jgi:hypothetical protein
MKEKLIARAEAQGLKLICRADGSFLLDDAEDTPSESVEVVEFANESELEDYLGGMESADQSSKEAKRREYPHGVLGI